MINIVASNEQLKRKYLKYEQEANGKSPKTIKKIKHSLFIFDKFFKKDYKKFNFKVATAFKEHLDKLLNEKTKMPIRLATKKEHIYNLKNFLIFLSREKGYKKYIQYNDIEYLNLSNAEEAKLRANNAYIDFPSIDQCIEVLNSMPNTQLLEKRNRAIFATLILSGVRIEALSSLSIASINIHKRLIKQNAKYGVKTKFSKNIDSFYFPVGKIFENELEQWVLFLTQKLKYTQKYPLFPCSDIKIDDDLFFNHQHFAKEPKFFKQTNQVRKIIKVSFKSCGYSFNPHSIRHMLAHLGQEKCKTPEEFKAWSQNLGHESVDTTLQSYGTINIHRVEDIFLNLKNKSENN